MVREPGRFQQGLQVLGHPGVHHRRGAVVPVVAQVRRDPDERGRAGAVQVLRQPVVGHDSLAPRRIVGQVRDVHERIMLLRVGTGRDAPVAGHRHGLHVGLPADPPGVELVDQRLALDPASTAVRVDAEGRARQQLEVVRQAGVGRAVGVLRRAEASGQTVEVGRLWITDDGALLPVLEDHHHHVGDGGRWRRTARHEAGRRGAGRRWAGADSGVSCLAAARGTDQRRDANCHHRVPPVRAAPGQAMSPPSSLSAKHDPPSRPIFGHTSSLWRTRI